MVRKARTWPLAVVVGLVSLTETAQAGTPTPAPRADMALAQAVKPKRTPASRLVRPKTVAQAGRSRGEDPAPRYERAAPPLDLEAPAFEEMPADEPDELTPDEPSRDRYAPEEPAIEETLPEPVETDRYAPDAEPKLPEPATLSPRAPAAEPVPAEKSVATGEVFRLEPPNKLVPVPREELKPGVIYLHDSPRLGRRVWSFLQANGEFWHAFGPGTTQTVDQFDFRMTADETTEALKKIDPKLAFEVSSSAGAKVFMRLDKDNSWKLVRKGSVSSIYDLETDQRWEKQWDRYLPVVHISGDTWEYREGAYQAPHWADWMRPN